MVLGGDRVEEFLAVGLEAFSAGTQRGSCFAPLTRRHVEIVAVGGYRCGEHFVECPVGPLHDVEGVITDRRFGQCGLGGGTKGCRFVDGYRFDIGALIGGELVVEGIQRFQASAGLNIDDVAGAVIADDGQVFVWVAVADLIDANAWICSSRRESSSSSTVRSMIAVTVS